MDAVRALAVSVREERVILGEPSDRTAISMEDTIRKEYERWLVPAGAYATVPVPEETTDE